MLNYNNMLSRRRTDFSKAEAYFLQGRRWHCQQGRGHMRSAADQPTNLYPTLWIAIRYFGLSGMSSI